MTIRIRIPTPKSLAAGAGLAAWFSSAIANADPGHGPYEASQLAHYLSTPRHALPLIAGLAAICIAGLIVRLFSGPARD